MIKKTFVYEFASFESHSVESTGKHLSLIRTLFTVHCNTLYILSVLQRVYTQNDWGRTMYLINLFIEVKIYYQILELHL